MANVNGLFALITGCGEGGIGNALALEFKAKGYTVITTLLEHEPREHLTELGIHVFTADVTKDNDVEQLCKDVSDITGDKLSILVNNAGIAYTMTAIDTDVEEVEKMFAVNVFGSMRMVHYFHPMLIRGHGTIVNIGSVGGIVPYVYGSSYNASKAALHHWGNTLRVEMRPLGVHVVNVISGEVATNILKRDNGRELPPTSFYRPLEAEFSKHVNRTPKTTTPGEYAKAVVSEVTKKQPSAWFFTGARSGMVWLGDLCLPRTFWDWVFAKEFNLNKLESK
ncbi:short chain dehydrogenase [Xylaria acuta]|nr:short chain dehydrogenase [Xylaria acuta]